MAVETVQPAISLPPRLFTVAEYDQMIEAGILTEDERIELIAGVITEMSPIGIRHVAWVNDLNMLIIGQLGRSVISSVQNPVHIGEYSEPQPDLVVLRPRADRYRQALPTPADVFLVIEVADTSLEVDRRVKVPLYARAGIPEVWLINLVAETVEVYTEPVEGVYKSARTLKRGDAFTATLLPDLTLTVDQLFD